MRFINIHVLVCIFSLLVLLMVVYKHIVNYDKIDNYMNIIQTDNSKCSAISYTTEPISCLSYLKSCHDEYYENVILKNINENDRNYIDLLAMTGNIDISKVTDPEALKIISTIGNMYRLKIGNTLGSECTIPIKHFQKFEIDDDCLKNIGGNWFGVNIGCSIPIPEKVPPPPPSKYNVQNSKIPPQYVNDKFMAFVDELHKRNITGLKPPQSVMPFIYNVQLPDINEFPDLTIPIMKYRQYYYQQKQIFDSLPVRCGYIYGMAYSYNKPNGENAVIPIVQKKFKDKYYTLIYRYGTDAFRRATEISEGLSEWFEKDTNWDKPKPKADVLVDPNNNYDNINKFLSQKGETYRDRFLFDNIKKSQTRYSIIIEVFNSYNTNPIFTLDLARYGSDKQDILKFFSSARVRDTEYTSNKNIITEQFNTSLFSIKNNGAKDVAWTIAMKKPSCIESFPVYMCIPTANVCMPNTQMCNWQKWFSGNIIVSNDTPIDLNGQINDFDNFKKTNIGEWMNIWAYAEYSDNFQNIEMNTGKYVMNPYAFRAVFNRPQNIDDDKWALLIWKIISGDETNAAYSQTYKDLIPKLKNKQQLEFEDYIFACKNALANGQQKPFAVSMACI